MRVLCAEGRDGTAQAAFLLDEGGAWAATLAAWGQGRAVRVDVDPDRAWLLWVVVARHCKSMICWLLIKVLDPVARQ